MTDKRVLGTLLAVVVAASAAGCAGGAGADDAQQPTVVESLPAAGADDGAPGGGQENGGPAEVGSEKQDAEEPGTEPTPVPASSDGPAQNWPVPEPPEEIYEPTEEGAEALIQHWFDARHYARVTGDTEPLEYFSHEECVLCQSHLERLDEVFSNDGWYVSDPDDVGDTYLRMESETVATGLLALHESDFESFWEGASYGVTEAETAGAHQFRAVHEDGRWRVAGMSLIGEYGAQTVDRRESNGDGLREPESAIHTNKAENPQEDGAD
ncbi:DUF6318 family protein [Nesterenkonia muleiensis]|uniref:DUF6318 family protein n=1 Tax=Nesterenkonia muleiensis TaxID=2282648 RepID=UPI000E71822E|nr:DUF6318 family protein [Nesterenkonia muleiensis]